MLGDPTLPPIEIGDVEIYAFDICVALAVVVGVITGEQRAKKLGLDRWVIIDITLWALIPGFIISHFFSLFFYFPDRLSDPWSVLNPFAGMSSLGGFLGGAAGCIAFFRIKKIPIWPYSNPIIFGLMTGWIFGRLGCTLAFDHPGIETDFFLGMLDVRDNVYRHNLGFYELLWTISIVSVFFLRRNKPNFAGFHTVFTVLAYMPVRFFFDFLRIGDDRYAGLTAAQWATVFVLGAGIWLYRRLRARGEYTIADGRIHIFPDGTPAITEKD